MSQIPRSPASRLRNLAIGLIICNGLGLFTARSQSPAAPPHLPQPTFEAASVRLSPPNAGYTSISTEYPASRFTARNASLKNLISIAYGVNSDKISTGADWLDTQLYDVSAKVEDDAPLTREQMRPLVQNLLEQRFHLTTHREKRDVTGYALILAKNGPKLQANKGAPQLAYRFSDRLLVQDASVQTLAAMLSMPVQRPVIDKTGIAGTYDFDLHYADFDPHYATADNPDRNLPDIFTALQEQLGLKLESQKVPVDFLIIDHVDRIPTEN